MSRTSRSVASGVKKKSCSRTRPVPLVELYSWRQTPQSSSTQAHPCRRWCVSEPCKKVFAQIAGMMQVARTLKLKITQIMKFELSQLRHDGFWFLSREISNSHRVLRRFTRERPKGIDGKGMVSKYASEKKKAMCVRFLFVQPGAVSTCNE